MHLFTAFVHQNCWSFDVSLEASRVHWMNFIRDPFEFKFNQDFWIRSSDSERLNLPDPECSTRKLRRLITNWPLQLRLKQIELIKLSFQPKELKVSIWNNEKGTREDRLIGLVVLWSRELCSERIIPNTSWSIRKMTSWQLVVAAHNGCGTTFIVDYNL